MDAKQFLAEFGHIANAPGGVGRLRELVLQLAISGRLIERSTPETPVSESLRVASKQRRQYEEDFELRLSSPHSPIKKPPYWIPNHWEWVRLEQVALYVQRGKGPNYADHGSTRVVSQKCVQWANFDLRQARFITDDSISSYGKERFLCDGDILLNSTGTGTAGRVAIYGGSPNEQQRCVADSHVTVIRLTEAAAPRYLWCILASPWVQSRIHPSHPESLVAGTTQQVELATSTARALPIPCPPIEEQSRIVAKVDELMALCDSLEARQQERRTLQNALRRSTLQALATAASPHELQTAWARLEANFGRLFSTPEDLDNLRQGILDLAMTGRLSEQVSHVTPNDVACLRARKKRLSDEKRIKRETPITDFPGINEMLTEIPSEWKWIRLNDIASVVRGGSPRPAGDPKFYGGDIPFLKVADVTSSKGMFVLGYTSTITEAGLNKTREISTRTVLLTNSGATLGVPAICEFRTTFNDGIAAFIELSEMIFDEYLYLFLKSKTKWLQDIASRGQGQPNLNTEIIKSLWFPFSPNDEQKRIVARVKKLLGLCDALESRLSSINNTSKQFADSVATLTGLPPTENKPEPT